jgi:hypothetical protein
MEYSIVRFSHCASGVGVMFAVDGFELNMFGYLDIL